ncbi:hypothetical protein ACFE04_024319 [Oxalis oulophora]
MHVVFTERSFYDSTAYTECKATPAKPLYNAGILENQRPTFFNSAPAFALRNLTRGNLYSFSSWVKIQGFDSAPIKAILKRESTINCIGTVLAKSGCWSFLKGGFVVNSSSAYSDTSSIFFQNTDGRDVRIDIASASLQPFTEQEWRNNQNRIIEMERKRNITINVADKQGQGIKGANITVEQISNDFPFGSAISSNILDNLPYQKWFLERFDVTVFENELKWYATEAEQGKVNYTIVDQMLEFVKANKISIRGHNILWEDPKYLQKWVSNLKGPELQSAVDSRIQSLMQKYKGQFMHWDVNNEMLHFDFYEQSLGSNATLKIFKKVLELDPSTILFMNDYNVLETCSDPNSTVDNYILKMRELQKGGVGEIGIGLEGHFLAPNPPLIRAILDKFGTLQLPIWLTEVDISKNFDWQTQATYLEQVLREAFSHPSVNGIILWTALQPGGSCYQMCLTDNNMKNLPAGDVVDKLLKEWRTEIIQGTTNDDGSCELSGFLGGYKVSVSHGDMTINQSVTHILSFSLVTVTVTVTV